jgi:hypothetical protein
VDRVGAGALGDLEELLLHEVAVPGGRAPERVGLVGDLHVQRVAVGIGVDRDRPDPSVLAGPCDAHGDLATVGDEDAGDGCSAVGRHGLGA